MSLKEQILKIAKQAKQSSNKLALLSRETKDGVLKDMASNLEENKEAIIQANQKDLRLAKLKKYSQAIIDRLTLNDKRISQMADSLREVANLANPVGEVMRSWTMPNGLLIKKVRVPIGTVGIIYESRPDVTADCIGLCLKSGNSVILKGGSEALNSNLAIFKCLRDALIKHKIPEAAINLISTTDRKALDFLLRMDSFVDLIIPRGGEGLIRKVVKKSRIPVVKHYKGICHVYVDSDADLNMAENICLNAKVQRPGVCNAMESMLVHRDIAIRFLPGMIKKLQESSVEIRGCPVTRKIVKAKIKLATVKDYATEYLDLILSVKVVESLDAAIEHVNKYGTHHSDSIVTDDETSANEFLKRVDSACVYVNASTRFTDGNQFGMGAEIGISTDKIHARGPMALEELCSYKYQIYGSGQIRQ
ncbi:MAG: glutamate-5-semialdehyde dehydrogenase [Candidatus Omnitrophota bacterium]|nr:glutamate-5-semialdehyde dehydrogenase [Candidatus Omnitrophota bacterium]